MNLVDIVTNVSLFRYRYYNLDVYHRRKLTKERMRGLAKVVVQAERTDFNDEDERRYEMGQLALRSQVQ